MSDKPEIWSDMDALSAYDELEAAVKASRKFVIRLYSSINEICDNLNDLRLKLASTKSNIEKT